MALNTLLGQPTDQQIKALPARLRNPERIKQHLDAFALHLQGVSYRGIQDHFGWKSLSTAQNSVKRGEELAKKLNLDSEKIRLKIAAAFDYLADVTVQQVKEQVANGRITQIARDDGSKEVRKTAGVDPRMLGEAGRGLIRFAEFAGLMDRAPEVNQAATTLIQLSAPADGVSFADKWSSGGETVDAHVMPTDQQDSAETPLQSGMGHSIQRANPQQEGR